MTRAPEGSPASRPQLIEADSQWEVLRDDLHAFALTNGAAALQLAQRRDLCTFGNRDYELWQPLLALAALFEKAGVVDLVPTVREAAEFARESRERASQPSADVLLLQYLAEAMRAGCQRRLTPKGLLEDVQRDQPDVFEGWGPERVASTLLRYGLRTVKSNGVRTYGRVTTVDLRRVQELYGLDLGDL
jgi:hypothetical protein